MFRTRSSISYEILHGLKFPANMSTLIAYMSYFPPPPPILPAPPARRSWTCSPQSLSCLVSDDYNPPSLRHYSSPNQFNDTKQIPNRSYSTTTSSSSSLAFSLLNFFRQHQLISILLVVLILFTILFLILIIYYQRSRQRQTNSNDKNKKFYYHLIPHRQKKQTNKNVNEENLVRLRKDPSPSSTIRIHENNQHETEEAV